MGLWGGMWWLTWGMSFIDSGIWAIPLLVAPLEGITKLFSGEVVLEIPHWKWASWVNSLPPSPVSSLLPVCCWDVISEVSLPTMCCHATMSSYSSEAINQNALWSVSCSWLWHFVTAREKWSMHAPPYGWRHAIGRITFTKVNKVNWEGLLGLEDQDGTCVLLPCEDSPPTPVTSEENIILERKKMPWPKLLTGKNGWLMTVHRIWSEPGRTTASTYSLSWLPHWPAQSK